MPDCNLKVLKRNELYTSSAKRVFFSPLIISGNTQIGSRIPENSHDIQLKGNLVAEDHW